MSSERINAKLREFYGSALPKLLRSWKPATDDSRPMLIKVSAAYSSATLRVAVIGQEAGGWGETYPCAVDPLMNLYAEFMAGEAYSYSPFWQAARHVIQALVGTYNREALLWSNLVKVDVRKKRPPPELEARVASVELVQNELSIASPDVVLFQTGPRYDARLLETFPGASIHPIAGGTAAVEGLPWPAVRTYHGRYLRMSRRWKELDVAVRHLERRAHAP